MASFSQGRPGFAYPGWKPGFIPKSCLPEIPRALSRRLNAVEINYTFRRLAALSTLTAWVEATQPGFLLLQGKYADYAYPEAQGCGGFHGAVPQVHRSAALARRLGPILFKLPPTLKHDLPLLAEFLSQLPNDLKYTFEFRHTSWLIEATYKLLADHKIALCAAESEKLRRPK